MKHRQTFTVIIEPAPDAGGFIATIPTMPGVVGRGGTEEEALRRVKAALESAPRDFGKATDPATLAKEQGVSAADFEDLLGDFWPEDEEPDKFTAALEEWRRESDRRVS